MQPHGIGKNHDADINANSGNVYLVTDDLDDELIHVLDTAATTSDDKELNESQQEAINDANRQLAALAV